MGYRLADQPDREKAAPKRANEQEAPEPERPTTPDEDRGVSIQELQDPPQAEGQRDRA